MQLGLPAFKIGQFFLIFIKSTKDVNLARRGNKGEITTLTKDHLKQCSHSCTNTRTKIAKKVNHQSCKASKKEQKKIQGMRKTINSTKIICSTYIGPPKFLN
jgi:hypothetical protein